jgi:hypothetical protein
LRTGRADARGARSPARLGARIGDRFTVPVGDAAQVPAVFAGVA